jgi:hypothetical protein
MAQWGVSLFSGQENGAGRIGYRPVREVTGMGTARRPEGWSAALYPGTFVPACETPRSTWMVHASRIIGRVARFLLRNPNRGT